MTKRTEVYILFGDHVAFGMDLKIVILKTTISYLVVGIQVTS